MMTKDTDYDWGSLLHDLNTVVLKKEELTPLFQSEFVNNGWLGSPPASEREISDLEERIGMPLPLSYKSFLLTTNGWGPLSSFIWRVLPASEVDWCKKKSPDLFGNALSWNGPPVPDEDYFVYGDKQLPENFRPEYLTSALQISDIGDSAVLLLNPSTQDRTTGEWEAWFFATWLVGAQRYKSFFDLVRAFFQEERTKTD